MENNTITLEKALLKRIYGTNENESPIPYLMS